jgi:hypothetical protein
LNNADDVDGPIQRERCRFRQRRAFAEEPLLAVAMGAATSASRKRRRNSRESTRTSRKKRRLLAIQRSPSSDRLPPGDDPVSG